MSPQEDELSKVPAGAVRVLPASGDGGRGGVGRVGGGKERGGERGEEGNGVVGMKEDDISSWDRYMYMYMTVFMYMCVYT